MASYELEKTATIRCHQVSIDRMHRRIDPNRGRACTKEIVKSNCPGNRFALSFLQPKGKRLGFDVEVQSIKPSLAILYARQQGGVFGKLLWPERPFRLTRDCKDLSTARAQCLQRIAHLVSSSEEHLGRRRRHIEEKAIDPGFCTKASRSPGWRRRSCQTHIALFNCVNDFSCVSTGMLANGHAARSSMVCRRDGALDVEYVTTQLSQPRYSRFSTCALSFSGKGALYRPMFARVGQVDDDVVASRCDQVRGRIGAHYFDF